jgi:hypothetical protein
MNLCFGVLLPDAINQKLSPWTKGEIAVRSAGLASSMFW